MWTIASLNLSAVPGSQAYMNDGLPVVGTPRNTVGSSYRLMIAPYGYVDITDAGPQPSGPAPDQLAVMTQPYWYASNATLSLTVASNGSLSVSGDGNSFAVPLVAFPPISANDIALVDQMVKQKILPYQQLVGGARPFSAVAALAKTFFPWTPYDYQLALALYDWTTADFFRMDVFNYFRFTAYPGQPLSAPDIVHAIWTSSWSPYTPKDAPFMNSMMMIPALSEADVALQYEKVNQQLQTYLDALKRVTAAALDAMPRTSYLSKPKLYSGQVDVSNLSIETFPVYFTQYPGNAGPPPMNMAMPLPQALTTFMQPGQLVNLKSFMSFTDSLEEAIKYSNGIVVEMSPQKDPPTNWNWLQCAYITALSNEVDKTEYLFMPGSQFIMGQSSQQTYDGKNYTVIQMSEWTL
jgi:hypothetical protein